MSTALRATTLLDLWERGGCQRPAERALSILAAAQAGADRTALAGLTLGERDRRLLAVREATFGRAMRAFAECPSCAQPLEFTLFTHELAAHGVVPELPVSTVLVRGDSTLTLRAPRSVDLLAIADVGDADSARRRLLARCLVSARRGGEPVAVDELNAETVAAIEARIGELDPSAETRLELTCPSCGHRWATLFDIGEFLWMEIVHCAKRLLSEIHALASAYGWSEAEVLQVSPARRRWYLERVL